MIASRDGDMGAEDLRAFEAWLRADDRHRRAWERLQKSVEPFRTIVRQPGGAQLGAALERGRTSRRAFLVRGAACMGAGAASLGIADRFMPLTSVGADYRTANAERRQWALPDGSRLSLNARSQADLAFQDGARGVSLRGGTALVDVAAAGAVPADFGFAAGPLVATAASGRLMMSRKEGRVRAISVDAEARLLMGDADSYSLRPGEGYAFTDGVLSRLPVSCTADAESWIRGKLVLHDRPLTELADALRPYLIGVLSLSQRVADLRVSGVFDLDSPDETLNTLTSLFPVWILRVGPFFSRMGHVADRR